MRTVLLGMSFLCSVVSAQAAMVLEDFPGPGRDWSGLTWTQFTDGRSSLLFRPDRSPGFGTDKYCAHLEWTLRPGTTYPYAGVQGQFRADGRPRDLSGYTGIRFYARGSGVCTVSLPTNATRQTFNHYSTGIILHPDWQLYELDFSAFSQKWGEAKPWDPAQVWAVGFNAEGDAGQMDLARIELYAAGEKSGVPTGAYLSHDPKVDQVGYLPDAQKHFRILAQDAKPGDPYTVLDPVGNTVFAGAVLGPVLDDGRASGEIVAQGDFSDLTRTGQYALAVNGKVSHPFRIADDLYTPLYRDALHCFYLVRCGTEVRDDRLGLRHPPCHLQDAALQDGAGLAGDYSGGWHNAGDYGKWCHMEAISIAYMLWLHELKPSPLRARGPEPAGHPAKLSDLLAEAQWGLRFLLKLQRPDGSVWHKVDTQPDFCFGTPPDRDPLTRRVSFQSATVTAEPSSIDAGDFTAVMAQAARVYAVPDPEFAGTCAQAARRSWVWLRAHPNVGQNDPYYTDPESWQEYLWAAAEMFRLTGEPAMAEEFKAALGQRDFQPLSWQTPQAFGYLSLWSDPRTPLELRQQLRDQVAGCADDLRNAAAGSGYGVALRANEYNWESNETVLHRANVLVVAALMTGEDDYRALALHQLDYLLGQNALDLSFVTGYGSRAASHPYHWTLAAYHLLMPGWVVGGPNAYPAGADPGLVSLIRQATPPAKCYLDLCSGFGSWASNEGEITANAALLFLTGYFSAAPE